MSTETNKQDVSNVFDFSDGAHMSAGDRKRWIEEAVAAIRSGQEYYTVSSGNSIVLGKKVTFSHDPDNPVIEIIEVPNGYIRHRYPFPKLSQLTETQKPNP